jgi:hypothetical protein
MDGIEDGVDRVASAALLDGQRLPHLEAAYLRTVIVGGQLTNARLHQMEKVKSPICPFCSVEGRGVKECLVH